MKEILVFSFIIVLDMTVSSIQNGTQPPPGNAIDGRKRLSRLKSRSTSSSSAEKDIGSSDSGKSESLDLSISESSESRDRSYIPKSTKERRGWRKYHRKCTPCPERKKKWRDPTIKWICGGYQRARRSFKSECMMYYRNCQDGTMFTKIHDHRCANDTPQSPIRRGDHFFYEYTVKLIDDSSSSGTASYSDSEVSSSSF